MASLATRMVWAMPALRDLAATLKGLQLHHERYGRRYREIIEEIQDRDTWSREKLLAYQAERLRSLIRHAAAHVPYYRNLFGRLGLSAEHIQGIQDLPKLPILEKRVLREDPFCLMDEREERSRLITEETSGTTGTPLRIYKTRESLQANYAYYEARCRQVAGMEFGKDPFVMLGVRQVAPIERTRPPFWCYNYVWKQLYMSVYHLSDQYLGAYCRELRGRPYRAVLGYPSSIYAVARYVLEAGKPKFDFKAALTSAETLYDEQRSVIEEAFGCRVYDQYGCSENCAFAAECREGRMHISPEYGVVEVVDQQGRVVPPGVQGDLICTGLVNFGQVLIRYRIGDTGALSAEACPCGSPLPVLGRLEGRTDQLLITRDGRRIARFDPVLKDVERVKECQIVQDDLDLFRIRLVPAAGYGKADGERVVQNLIEYIGDARIELVIEDSIERAASGKFIASVCNLTKEQIRSACGAAAQ
ncbi:MAG: phenylacetate--CoA ligase family protein [Phycisphaerales bacterium]|nr:MAG: phenylacetate--CoA ligase family protein [Phycisphaerales bacterium]